VTRAITFRLLAGVVSAAFLLAGCTGPQSDPSADTRTAGSDSSSVATTSPSGSATPATRGRPAATEVVGGLTSPWGLVALKNGSLLVSERDTRQILLVDGKAKRSLRTIDEVDPGGEGGLLGLAVTPDERQVFAYYTAADDNRIATMSFDGRTLGEPRVILDGIPKGQIHNGGRIVVGPDGYLYAGTGDSADSELAQDRSSLGGKILRITLDGNPAPKNPFGNEVFSMGHRNVQGLAFDDSDRLWACEFGSQEWDELNLIEAGNNYGWPLVEGSGEGDGLTNPKVVWRTSEASPSGLAYWQGALWMAGLRGERLWEIPVDGTDAGDPVGHFKGDYGRLRSVVVASDGRSLLMTGSNTDGRGEENEGDDRLLRVTR
jgi:glucose/arabinose dehydrogenase